VRQRTAELQLEIAARKRTELELMRSNEDLQQFAWSASHDLQEPIRNVSIYGELLRHRYKGKIDAEADFFLDNVAEGALRMGALVRDLLAFAQVSGTVDEDVEEIDANIVLAKVVENLAAVIEENRVCINSQGLPVVRMREVHLQQILQNLLSNAIKYRSKEAPRIDISAQPADSGGFHLCTVSDNGIGIEPQYHERIFGLFKRLHRDENHPGTGLGLAICKRTVERYRGRIWVESEPGKGSAFFFTLPAG
jgi:light-regulated signal transduction histidine kinase (bacteriophytochrome)